MNSSWREESKVREHLICDGFMEGYDTWLFHGEPRSSSINHEGVQVESSLAHDEFSDLLRDIACGLDDGGM